MASIKDVAALAGVSPATVSRVINGTARVDEEKTERVRKAIEETGFVPNEVARSLFKKSAKTIGLIIPSIDNPFFIQLASAIERTADANGYKILLCNTGGDVQKEKDVVQMLMAMNTDGIIITTSTKGVDKYIENCSIPVIVTDRQYANNTAGAYVHSNHYECGRMAAKYLIKCGCKNIVCFKGPQDISSAIERYKAYKDVCTENGIEEKALQCGYDFDSGIRATEKLLEIYPEADGIIASNDIVAISAYKVLHKNGIKVPEQIQIIGFDNINLSQLITPELTTIAQPINQIGIKAAELIVHKNNDNTCNNEYIFEGELIVRETTKKCDDSVK